MTMTPSKFTLNSDYLSIAQTDSKEYTIAVGGGSLTPGGYTEQNFDLATAPNQGAIDRVLISYNGGDYMVGAHMELVPTWSSDYSNNVAGFLLLSRTSSTNIRAQLVLEGHGSGTNTYPAMAFRIKISSFKPPNVF